MQAVAKLERLVDPDALIERAFVEPFGNRISGRIGGDAVGD